MLGSGLTGLAILVLVWRLGCSPDAGVAAASFPATMAGRFGDWVGLAQARILAHGLVAAGAAILVGARERKTAAAALATNPAFASAEGVSANFAFDLVIASSVGLGLVWDRAGEIGDDGAPG